MSDQTYRRSRVQAPADLTWTTGTTTGANAVVIQFPAQTTGSQTQKNVIKRLIAQLGVTGAQTPVTVSVYNAASGSTAAGNLIGGPFILNPAVSTQDRIDLDDLDIEGSAGTAMTVIMTAPVAGSTQMVNLQTYLDPKLNGNI
jgi:hypothetical protein